MKINGERHYLGRAVDHEGEVLEAVVTKRHDKRAALKFLRKFMKRYGCPGEIVTDRCWSYGAALKALGAQDRQPLRRGWSSAATHPFRNTLTITGSAVTRVGREGLVRRNMGAPLSREQAPTDGQKSETDHDDAQANRSKVEHRKMARRVPARPEYSARPRDQRERPPISEANAIGISSFAPACHFGGHLPGDRHEDDQRADVLHQ